MSQIDVEPAYGKCTIHYGVLASFWLVRLHRREQAVLGWDSRGQELAQRAKKAYNRAKAADD